MSTVWLAGLLSVAPSGPQALELGPHYGLPKCDENFTPECVDPNLSYEERSPSCKDSLVSADRRPFERHAPRGFGICETMAFTRRVPLVVVEVPDMVPKPPAGFSAISNEPCPPVLLGDGTYFEPPPDAVGGPHTSPPLVGDTKEPRGETWACAYAIPPQPIPIQPAPIPSGPAGQGDSGAPPCGGTPHPCNPANGNKFRSFSLATDPIPLTLFYNSRLPIADGLEHRVGAHWSHTYSARLYKTSPEARHVDALRPDGRYVRFVRQPDDTFLAQGDAELTLRRTQVDGELAWIVSHSDGSREIFWASGQLVGRIKYMEDPAGRRTTVVYDWRGQVHELVGPFGHKLRFINQTPVVRDIIDPIGGVIRFGYDNGNLTSITHQDGTRRTFFYDDPNFPHHLTAIADETMNPDSDDPNQAKRRHARFSYYPPEHPHAGKVRTSELAPAPSAPLDADGRPIGQERVTLTYGSSAEGLPQTTVVDARGHRRTLTYPDVRWRKQPLRIEYEVDGQVEVRDFGQYDAYNRSDRVTDPRGNVTEHAYSDRHQTSRTEAAGVPEAQRSIRFEYLDAHSDLVTRMSRPSVTRGADGAPRTQVTVTQYTNDPHHPGEKLPLPRLVRTEGFDPFSAEPISRSTETTWVSLPVVFREQDSEGAPIVEERMFLVAVDGARTDSEDLTVFTYYRACPVDPLEHCGRLGRLRTVTDAMGQVTTILRYDASGRPLRQRGPNGLITDHTYDQRGRLIRIRELALVDGAQRPVAETSYVYTPDGRIARITSATGKIHAWEYDAAGQLAVIRDALGNRVEFTYDLTGNRTRTRIVEQADGAPRVRYLEQSRFDARNREIRSKLGGVEDDFSTGSVVAYKYDDASNIEGVSDPNDTP